MKKILLSFLVFALLALPAAAATVKVKANRTPLRGEATATSSALAYYQAGDILDLLDVEKDWYKVRDPKTGQEGFILARLAELLPADRAGQDKAAAAPKGPALRGPAAPQAAPTSTKPAAPAATKKPGAASGQWTDRGYIVVNGAYQAGSKSFSETFSFGQYLEQASVTAQYPRKDGPGFDAGGAFRVWRNLAMGASVSGVSRSTSTTVSGSIPHPFFYGDSRNVATTVGTKRQETALHLQAAWVVPVGRKMLLAVSGGPSMFSVTQSLVRDVTFSEDYPYDTAMLNTLSPATVTKSAAGFNAGADIGYYFSKTIGVGATIRYAGATVSLPSHESNVSVKVGGMQAGVGLRVRLPKGTPKKAPTKPQLPQKPVK